jgi:flagellar biosynthetic protein FliR
VTANLAEWVELLSGRTWIGFVVFFRVAAIAALLPGFGEQSVSMRIKLMLAFAFTLIVAPSVRGVPENDGIGTLAFLVLSETATGLMFGLGLRLFILALQTAGMIAAQSTSLSQLLGAASVEPIPALGYVLVVSGICLAMTLGLHVKAAQLMILTYDIAPIGAFIPGGTVAEWGIGRISHAFVLAFTVAAPFVLLSVIYNLVLGVINKAMPQLMVAFVGAPFITFGGLFLLFITSPLILEVWSDALDGYLANPTAVVR